MPAAQDNHSTRILVVDDDEIILIALAETLRHEGYSPVTTQSPREALEFLKGRPFSVIISDQRMAEMTGLEFLQEAARIQPTASRILITGILTLKTVIDAINSGEIFRFIAKPWLREELLATIRNAAQRHELLETNRRLQESTLRLNAQLAEANSLLQQKIRELTEQKDSLSRAHAEMRNTFEQS
ncbi:MAG TPA: response regulator, partial [Opitutales bacterium]|nr:response regulator [Opitutales bacterium]